MIEPRILLGATLQVGARQRHRWRRGLAAVRDGRGNGSGSGRGGRFGRVEPFDLIDAVGLGTAFTAESVAPTPTPTIGSLAIACLHRRLRIALSSPLGRRAGCCARLYFDLALTRGGPDRTRLVQRRAGCAVLAVASAASAAPPAPFSLAIAC